MQTFEYALSHYMDKAFESVMGFINVLPGAFSIYRWVAIRGEPLAAYFTLEETPARELNPFTCNMYLAEDVSGGVCPGMQPAGGMIPSLSLSHRECFALRLLVRQAPSLGAWPQLCALMSHHQLSAKRHRLWLLRWVAGATAYTDAPQTLVALIKQRRRWLNGSLFSLLYYLQHFSRCGPFIFFVVFVLD